MRPDNLTHTVIACFLALGAALALMVCTGCTVQSVYVEADRMTYKAVAPAYLDYVDDDVDLTPEQKERKRRLVRSWDARITEAEK